MAKTTDELIAALNAFEADPDDCSTVGDLYELLAGYEKFPDRVRLMPAMFGIIERFPDSDLGPPGPLVQAIESFGEDVYEPRLLESIARRPLYYTVWMVNRLLNSATIGDARRERLIGVLQRISEQPEWPDLAETAAEYLEFQAEQSKPAGAPKPAAKRKVAKKKAAKPKPTKAESAKKPPAKKKAAKKVVKKTPAKKASPKKKK